MADSADELFISCQSIGSTLCIMVKRLWRDRVTCFVLFPLLVRRRYCYRRFSPSVCLSHTWATPKRFKISKLHFARHGRARAGGTLCQSYNL